jgi:sugar phosphate permease
MMDLINTIENSGEMTRQTPTSRPRSRWTILFVVWAAFLLSYVVRVAWSTVAAPVGASLGISVAMLGAFLTAFYIGYVAANVTGGIITDTIGGRLTLTLALVPLGMATFCFGFTRSLTVGIAIQAVMGLAAGADYSAGVKIISSWFDHDRGRALGIYTTATSLAVVIANATIPTVSMAYGWENAFRGLGVLTLAWAAITFLALRDAPSPQRQAPIDRREIVALLRSRNLVLLALSGCGALWATVGFGAWGNALLTKHYGISVVTAGAIAASFGVGAVIAKPVFGMISDAFKENRKFVAIACLLCFSALLVVFGQCSTVREFYLLSPFLGAVAFGYLPVLMAQVTKASGPRLAGAAAGLTNAVWQLGSAAAPLVIGQVYSRSGSFSLSLVALAVGPLAAAVTLLFVVRGAAEVTAADGA